jgi:glycosyltransferase involved in cell wall biosynthesis
LHQNSTYAGYFRKKLTKIVLKQASAVLPVSVTLLRAMQNHQLNHPQYEIVYNVVDKEFYQEKEALTRTKKRILHVSCFSEQAKNVKGILRATRELFKQHTDFELILVGTGPDFTNVCDYAKALNFPTNTISFTGEQTPAEVAEWFRQSDVFVLFSNYETAGVVIAESIVSGVPVIATPTGIASEVINASNGLIVNFQDEVALQESILYILKHTEQYDAKCIRSEAQKQFSTQVIGQKIHCIYQRTLR